MCIRYSLLVHDFWAYLLSGGMKKGLSYGELSVGARQSVGNIQITQTIFKSVCECHPSVSPSSTLCHLESHSSVTRLALSPQTPAWHLCLQNSVSKSMDNASHTRCSTPAKPCKPSEDSNAREMLDTGGQKDHAQSQYQPLSVDSTVSWLPAQPIILALKIVSWIIAKAQSIIICY